MKSQRVLCVDLGTKMGFASWTPEDGEQSGWYDLTPWPLFAKRAARFGQWFTWAVTDRFQPDLLVIEEPFMSGPNLGMTAKHWMHYTFVRSHELAQAMVDQGWPGRLEELTPGAYKLHATGSGRATKAKVLAAVNKNGRRSIKSEDEADAIAMLMLIREKHRIGPDHGFTGRQASMDLVA